MARESGVPQGEGAAGVAERPKKPAAAGGADRPFEFVVPSGLSGPQVIEYIRRRYGVALDGEGI